MNRSLTSFGITDWRPAVFLAAILFLAIPSVVMAVAVWNAMPVPTGSVWHYLDDGTDQGTNWQAYGFDHSSWDSGPAELGYGDGDEATTNSWGPSSLNRYITTYYRHAVFFTNTSELTGLIMGFKRDDGIVIYVNGEEIVRNNMAAGAFDYRTRASVGVDGSSEQQWNAGLLNPSILIDGTNIIAAEIHQVGPRSSDISFDFYLQSTAYPDPLASFTASSSVWRYQLEASNTNMPGPATNNVSGCTFNPSTGELLAIVNNPESIQVHNADGSYAGRTITLDHFDDTEGMCLYDADNNLFAISEEDTNDISIVQITGATTIIDKETDTLFVVTNQMTIDGQVGTEGVTYDPERECYYAVKEKIPMRVYKISKAGTVDLFDAETVFTNLAADLADIHYDPYSQHLFILSAESERLFECTLFGAILGWTDLAGRNPEGLAFSSGAADTIVVGEPNEYFRYRAAPMSGQSGQGTTVDLTVDLSWFKVDTATVGYMITSATAVAGVDYSPASGTLTFVPGDTQETISFDILTNAVLTSNQVLQIILTNETGAVLGRDSVYEWTVVTNDLTLDVISRFGGGNPGVGSHTYNYATPVTCSVTNSPLYAGSFATQYVCYGWVGSGGVPGSGTGTTTPSFNMTADSSIGWHWRTNYWIGADASPGGQTVLGDQWIEEDDTLTVEAFAYAGHVFAGWSGNTAAADTNNPVLQLTSDKPRYVTAHFTPELTTQDQIPYPAVTFDSPTLLSRYVLETTNWLNGPVKDNMSGCAILESTSELLVVLNNPEAIFVYDLDGNDGGSPNRLIVLNGFDDTEGICQVDPDNDLYAVIEEKTNHITIVTITDSTTAINKSSGTTIEMGFSNMGNDGIEGISYDAANDCFYAAREYEFGPFAVYRVTTNRTPVSAEIFDAVDIFGPYVNDLSDIYYDPATRHLFTLSDLGDLIFETDLHGNILDTLSVPMYQPEGLTISQDTETLYVVGEHNAYRRYGRQVLSDNADEGTTLEIPVTMGWAWTNDVTVSYVITSATAIVGADFSQATGSVLFAAGSTSETISIDILFDTGPEIDELLVVHLLNPTNCTIGIDDRFECTIPANTTVTFVVTSDFGTPTPPVGTNYMESGAQFTASVAPIAVYDGPYTQYRCRGWTGAGDVPGSGIAATTAPLTINNGSAINWVWGTNYWLGADWDGPGVVWMVNRYLEADSNAVVLADANEHYEFRGWSGDTGGADTNINPLILMLDMPKSISANFGEILTTSNTPVWWLADNFPTMTNDLDVAATNDIDLDGMLTWQEYMAGTDPTNAASVLMISAVKTNSTERIVYWQSASNRSYSVFMSTNISSSWPAQPATNNVPGDPSGTTAFPHTMPSNRTTFYRVMVE